MTPIVDSIKKLQAEAKVLEPPSEEKHAIAAKASRYLDKFIVDSKTTNTFVPGSEDGLKAMRVTEEGKSFDSLLEVFHNDVNGHGINTTSGGHMGYIPGGGLWSGAIGDLLAAGTNRFSGIFYSSPGAVVLENQLIRWMCELFGYPKSAHGNLTSGGSIANLVAIQTARDTRKINSTNVAKSVIYFTGQVHHCIHKALQTLGLGEAVHRVIPMNDRYQMNAEALEAALRSDTAKGLQPFLIIASAGTTDSGAIDPINQVADIANQFGCWFHVDAAYGGFFILVDEIRKKFAGIERADSIVMDPHKSLFVPYGLGVVLIKDGSHLVETYSHQASYMQDAYGFDEISPADCGPELTKHFRGMRLWIPLHLHGLKAFRSTLEEKLLLTKYFREKISAMGFETGPEPQLSVNLFRYPHKDPNSFNQRLVDAIHEDGRCFFSSTLINGELWIRCAILNFRTHLEEVDRGLEMLGDCLRAVH
jgi:aromatic-L-amino-acid decarboxylase